MTHALGQVNNYYTIKDGLSSSFINHITQDHEDYLWVSTDDGLNRFDGESFTIIRNVPGDSTSLPSNKIFMVYEDSKDNLWVATMNGVVCDNRKGRGFICPSPLLRGNKSSAITEDQNGNIWATIHSKGVVCINPATGQLIKVLNRNLDSLLSDYVNVLYTDDNGNIWLGSGIGLSVYNPNNDRITHYTKGHSGLNGNSVLSITKDNLGRILIGLNDGGLCYFDPKTDRFFAINEPFAFKHPLKCIYAVASADDNSLWIATDGYGVQQLSLTSQRRSVYTSNLDNFLSSNSKIHAIFKDNQGNIWAGVYTRGLYQISHTSNTFDYYCLNSFFFGRGNVDFSSLSVIEDSRGYVWVGTDGGGIYRINRTTGHREHFKQYDTDPITALFEDQSGYVWVGSYLQGAFRYNYSKSAFDITINQDDGNRKTRRGYITTIAQVPARSPKGCGDLWFGTGGGGVIIYNPESGQRSVFSSEHPINGTPLVNDYINLLHATKERIWIATYGGLVSYSYHDATQKLYNIDNSEINNNVILSVMEDSKGKVWIGTNYGLNRLDPVSGDIINCTELMQSPINGIVEDNNGLIWFSTNNGMYCYDYKNDHFVSYRNDPQMLSGEFRQGCFFKSARGALYFGGTDGVISFMPPVVRSYVQPLKLQFTTLSYFTHDAGASADNEARLLQQKSIFDANHIDVSRSTGSFSIGFKAVTFNSAERIVYRTRIMRSDSKWEEVVNNNRQVSFTNLPSGSYTLEVMASIDDMEPLVKRLKIVVKPSLWRTNIAYLCYVILLLSLLYTTYLVVKQRDRIRLQRLRDEQEEKLIRHKLDFFVELSHEIRTPLTLVSSPLSKLIGGCKDPKILATYNLMERNVNRILLLINEMIDIRKLDNDQYTLSAEPIEVNSFAQSIVSYFNGIMEQRAMTLTFECDRETYHNFWADRPSMEKILFNLVSNAVKYSPDSSHIDFSICESENTLCITIKNSCGSLDPQLSEKIFQCFFKGSSDAKTSSGIGLYLTKKLVELHKGDISAEILDNIITITTIFPLGNSHYTSQERLVPQSSNEMLNPQIYDAKIERSSTRHRFKSSKRILLVEDDHEIRKYIVDELSNQYQVIEAADGLVATELAVKEVPDLVISDVMMPVMDGLALCKNLRNDPRIAHIPIILLSAKTTTQEQIEGMRESGADMYVTKPFNMDYLLTCVRNLINNRTIIRSGFTEGQYFANQRPDNVIVSADEKFMSNFNEIVRRELANPELSVEYLSKELYVSRVHLHRRIKSTYSLSPSDYIREQRLRMAETILTTNSLSVSEVSYMVGFNSPGSFAIAFKKLYGVTPSQYAELHHNMKNNSKKS